MADAAAELDAPVERSWESSDSWELIQGLRAAAQKAGVAASLAERLEVIVEGIDTVMAVGSASGWVMVSRRFSDELGYDLQALNETPYETLIHPNDLEETKAMAYMVERGELARGELRNRYRIHGRNQYLCLLWTWGPPRGANKLTVATAQILGVEDGPPELEVLEDA